MEDICYENNSTSCLSCLSQFLDRHFQSESFQLLNQSQLPLLLILHIEVVAAYAGLVPRERRSGSSVRGRPRLSKIGNARLRNALYFPAITTLRCSPFFKEWATGLRERGKCKMSVIGGAMRKLIHLAYGVLKTGKPFDPEWARKEKTA
jgi:transposase